MIRFPKNVGNNPDITAYVDAGYGVHEEGLSRSGLVIMINGAPVAWKSAKQSLVTKSSTEAELVALSDGSTDIIWLRELLRDQGYDIGPVTIFEDNQSVIAMLERKKHGMARTRHINVRYFFIIDRIVSGDLCVKYLPTDEMVADYFTKPLMGSAFPKLQLKLISPSRVVVTS